MPALQGKALCVSHSASKQGAGEVSSANYEARAFGVRAVMGIGHARQLCPNLIVMPYEFDKYEDISDKVSRSPCPATLQLSADPMVRCVTFRHATQEGTSASVTWQGAQHLSSMR